MNTDIGTWILDIGVLQIPKPKTQNRFFSSLAWGAVVLTLVVGPLLALIVDGARLFYVRGRLQTAIDAACEDAAWSAADRRAYRDTGATTFESNASIFHAALATFKKTLGDQASKQFYASATITPDYDQARMQCRASADVPLLTAGGLLFSPAHIRAESISLIRFTH